MGLNEFAQRKSGKKRQLRHAKSMAAVGDVSKPEEPEVGGVLSGAGVVSAGIRARGRNCTITATNSKQPQNLVTNGAQESKRPTDAKDIE